VGTLGRPGAYTQITLPSNFTGSLFYFLKSLTREFTYYVKTQPYYSERKYAMSNISGGAIHYKQIDISFSSPNRYYFEVEDSSDLSYQLSFGTTVDTSNNPALKITRGRTPGSTNAFVLLDVSGYTGTKLYYFDASFARMGSYPALDVSNTFVVTVSNNEFYLDGIKNKFLSFNQTRGRWRFDLSSSTNTNNQLYFSNDPYSIVNYYSSTAVGFRTAGQPGSYSTIDFPLSNYSGTNLYYVNESAVLLRDYTYYVKRVTNAYNQPAFSFSTGDGSYNNQLNLQFTAPNRYYLEYFFNMNDPSANLHNSKLVFGTTVDVSSSIYSGTVYKESVPGSYRSAVYLDLSGYIGDPLYAFNDVCGNMGYSPPPASPDFSYNVTVSGGVFHLNGISRLAIDFDASKTYLFIQSDPTNVGHPMIFGKLPDDSTNIVQNGVKIVGSLGKPDAYTLVTTPADFKDSLFYFMKTTANEGPAVAFDTSYSLKVVTNILGQKVYSVSISGGAFYNQPDISFTGPDKKYYFNVSDSTNSPYTLVFGTTVDVSSSIYNGTVYSVSGDKFVFLDLTDYTGQPLYMFTTQTPGMGYVPPVDSVNTYAVTVSDQYFLTLNDIEMPIITFQQGNSYVFRQNDGTNTNYQLMFSSVNGSKNYYTTNYSIVGTLGQPGAYTQITLPSGFSGPLFYFMKSLTREFSYDVIVQPYYSKFKYALKDVSGGTTHYNQFDISLVAPNKYYFTVADSTNVTFQLSFGTTPDVSSSNVSITRGRQPGSTNAFVYLDLSGYSGAPLFYFDSSNVQMGNYPSPVPTTRYIVTISNNDVYLGNVRYPLVQFNSAKGSIMFDQSNFTNTNNQLYFSRNPYSIQNYYDVSLIGYGTPGQPRAYSLITIPVGFTGNLYYVDQQAVLPPCDFTYYVKRSYNVTYGTPVFSFSTTIGGTYYEQVDLNLTANRRYYFEYFFEMNDPSRNIHPNRLVFGTSADVSSSIHTGTVYKESTPGSYRSAVYLDLSGYTGSKLYAFSEISGNMGYSLPPSTPDFSYNVTVSGGAFYLNGIPKLAIDFEANKTYLFLQSDPTNVGNPMIFGKLPDDIPNIVQTGIKIVGSLGQPEAYTTVTTSSSFLGPLFYFNKNTVKQGPPIVSNASYVLNVTTNIIGNKVYSVHTDVR
jgi:hypothetical protein